VSGMKKNHKKTEKTSLVFKNQNELAELFDVDVRTVQRWIRDGLPRTEKGFYDLAQIVSWWKKRNDERFKNDPEKKWNHEHARWRALLRKLQYKVKAGELIPREEVESEWLSILTTVKKKLLNLGPRIAPQVVGQEIHVVEKIITENVRDLLNAMTLDSDKNTAAKEITNNTEQSEEQTP